MAVNLIGVNTEDFASSGTNWTTRDINHTVPAGCTLLLLEMADDAASDTITLVVWDQPTANEAFTLIHATTNSASPGNTRSYVWGLVNPTVKTANIRLEPATGNIKQSSIGVFNFDGTETASVAAATNHLNEDVNDDNSATIDLASGGTVGNLLVAMGNFQHENADPISLSAGWSSIMEITDATLSSEFILKVATKSGVSACTMTRTGADDESSGILTELVAAASSLQILRNYYANQ